MNLAALHLSYDLHDSVVVLFSYCFEKRYAVCVLDIGDLQEKYRCKIKFNNITFFKIDLTNVDFVENELIDLKVSSDVGEYFKGYFSEGFSKPGKAVEIKCEFVEIEIVHHI